MLFNTFFRVVMGVPMDAYYLQTPDLAKTALSH